MARTLLAIYPQSARRYDEMLASDGTVRPHWQQFFQHLDQVSPEEMHQRLDFVDRRIQENGVTYNIYADPNGADRPWALDPLPLMKDSLELIKPKPALELLWASPREPLNIMQADRMGCQIITAPADVLKKLPGMGSRTAAERSLDAV